MCAATNTRQRNVPFERSRACNYSAHAFLPILFGVCAGIVIMYLSIVYFIARHGTHIIHVCYMYQVSKSTANINTHDQHQDTWQEFPKTSLEQLPFKSPDV